jgi:hypothetical protein
MEMIAITPERMAILAQAAARRGTTEAELLGNLIDTLPPGAYVQRSNKSEQEKQNALNDFLQLANDRQHLYPPDFAMDDRRDTIYAEDHT